MGGLIGFLGTLICGLAVFVEECNKNSITVGNEEEAKKQGKPYYYDGDGKLRAVATNEICQMDIREGMTRLIGIHSHREYWNSLADKNKDLEGKGKKYIWKSYYVPGFPHSLDIKDAWKFDPVKGMPFKDSMFRGNIWIEYYNPNDLTKEVEKVCIEGTTENLKAWRW